MELVIDRKEWLHGEGSNNSWLVRRSDGKKCCLGILSIACGLPADRLTDLKDPSRLRAHELPEALEWTVASYGGSGRQSSVDAARAMHLNDVPLGATLPIGIGIGIALGTESQREHMIADIFKQHGIDVRFEGEP